MHEARSDFSKFVCLAAAKCDDGLYYSTESRRCELCATHTYRKAQDDPSNSPCIPCDSGSGFTTRGLGDNSCEIRKYIITRHRLTNQESDPEWQVKILVNNRCEAIHVLKMHCMCLDMYQVMLAYTLPPCLNCVVNQTTKLQRLMFHRLALIFLIFVAICNSGYYPEAISSNTYSCELCPRGTYQPLRGQLTCIQCAIGATTVNVGSKTEDDCTSECNIKFSLVFSPTKIPQ